MPQSRFYSALAAVLVLLPVPATAEDEVVRELLTIPGVGMRSRSPVRVDPIEARLLRGEVIAPKAGDKVKTPQGEFTWIQLKANADVAFEDRALAGGYSSAIVRSEADRVAVLKASGHSAVLVNGAPRPGDPYSHGYTNLPVALKAGENRLLFANGRGRFQARLAIPRAEAELDASDATLPDLIQGRPGPSLGALVVLNCSEQAREDLSVRSTLGTGKPIVSPLPSLVPLTARKVGFDIDGPIPETGDTVKLRIDLLKNDRDEPLDSVTLDLRIRKPTDTFKVTFRSAIDGSVQYYAVRPAVPFTPSDRKPALVLSLHGASVEAIGQADAYSSKAWAHIVAPTNRRPFGFDWEDWGRLDALEVLDLAAKSLGTDPRRVYLTGHSMGGHGTWHLGVTYPDKFAAVGPSAGWISMRTYAGRRPVEGAGSIPGLLERASSPSDTTALASNYAEQGVYILHGSADDNVPAEQARRMVEELDKFHRDYRYHEQPGAGHWWDSDDEPGAACVDWGPMFDLFARRIRPDDDQLRDVDFVTAHPGVSARSHWLTIEAQRKPFMLSRATLHVDPIQRRFRGKTDNVARLTLSADVLPPGTISIDIDATTLKDFDRPKHGAPLRLAFDGKAWRVDERPTDGLKHPGRAGAFKDAFRNRAVLVYGTRGSAEENAWALAKARYDSEVFRYQGNGSFDVVPDSRFDPKAEPDRNVVLYGNADTNAAWQALLAGGPVGVSRESLRVGDRERKSPELGVLMIRPRPGSVLASVGVVGGTGPAGMRVTNRLPYFVSGVAYPDLFAASPRMLTDGVAGVVAAGYFGEDWGVAGGDFGWAD